MKKIKGEYWSNVGSKPTGFVFVKGEPMTYTYEVPVVFPAAKSLVIDKIFIKMKMRYDVVNKRIEIDTLKTKDLIIKEIGSDKFYFDNEGLFVRDRVLFPYIVNIVLFNIDKTDDIKTNYFNHRKIKKRREVLNRVMKNINQ